MLLLLLLLACIQPSTITAQTCQHVATGYSDNEQNDGAELQINQLLNALDFTNIAANIETADLIAEHATAVLGPYTNPTEQLECTNIVSCLQSEITFQNNDVCNIHCTGDILSCGQANINIDNCANVHIICDRDQACDSTNITITNANDTNITIACGPANACNNMRVEVFGMPTSTQVSCIQTNACDNLHIKVDDYTSAVLNMFSGSFDVVLDNNVGYQQVSGGGAEYLECKTKAQYIQWTNSLDSTQIKDLIDDEYHQTASDIWPCLGVQVMCDNTESCIMEYRLNEPYSMPSSSPTECYWVAVYDLIELYCAGNCSSSPTGAPTAAPSFSPTAPSSSPSAAPSLAPSIAPTDAPSGNTDPPSNAPSGAPTPAPTGIPTDTPTGTPSSTPTDAPTFSPTDIPTAAPTWTPTAAPTRSPTSSLYDYDTTMEITYLLQHLNDENINWILNNSVNNAIDYLQEVIESHYFNTKFLNKYEYFTVQISAVNGIDFTNTGQFTKDVVLFEEEDSANNQMRFESKVEFDWQYGDYILQTSKDTEWYATVTAGFTQYFSNSEVEFSVVSPEELALVRDDEEKSQLIFWALNALLALCITIAVAAWLYNKKSAEWTGVVKPVDEAAWFAVVLYGVQIYDIVSDINLTTEIFSAISDEKAHVPGEDDPGVVDSQAEWLLLVSGWLSLAFTIFPYVLNVWAATKIPVLTKKFVCTRNYFEKYRLIFIFLVVFSGGAYPALALICSNVFGMDLLNAGLSRFELNSLVKIRIATTVLTENLPQLGVQIMYCYSIGDVSQNTILAACTSIASIISSMMIYFMNKENQSEKYPMDYYLEIKKIKDENYDSRAHLDEYEDDPNGGNPGVIALSHDEKKRIQRMRGVTFSLSKRIAAIYDVDMTDYQIPYVHVRNDNFIIRVVHQLHRQDLMLSSRSSGGRTMTSVDFTDDEKAHALINEIKTKAGVHCHNSYKKHRRELKSIIFEHYQIDYRYFTILYHDKYPNKSLPDRIGQENITELVRVRTNIAPNNGGMITRGNDNNGYSVLNEYKEDLLKGIDIIKEETNALGVNTNNLTSLQINRFIKKLSDNEIKHHIIEDVLSVCVCTGTFKQRERRESDIDGSSDESFEFKT